MDEDIRHYQVLSLDRPCQHCRTLQLDDAAQGGIIEKMENGEIFVDFFYVKQSQLLNHVSPTQRLKLDYEREDILPGLPGLAITSSMGCAFCKILKDDVLSAWNKTKAGTSSSPNLRAGRSPDTSSNDSEGKACQGKLTFTEMRYRLYKPLDSETKSVERINGHSRKIYLDSLYVFFTIDWQGEKTDHTLYYNICADATDPCASWLRIPRRPISNDFLSPPSIKRLNTLIDKSMLEVPDPFQGNNHYPTHLLDIGSTTSPVSRLINSEKDPAFVKGERYAALSYCWGSKEEAAKQLLTTTTTIQDHISHIEFDQLTQTIADAVQLCRSLGIRYLWVDALCIIQDNKDDWAKEAFEMANVYSNSFITLCVIQGDSCTSGFLNRPHSPSMLQINFRSTLDESVSGKFYLRMPRPPEKILRDAKIRFFHNEFIVPLTPASTDFGGSAWRRRGWTFQESLLSPRKLFLGPQMYHISCGSLRESADGTGFVDDEFFPKDEKSLENALGNWYILVRKYSRRDLTYEQDRFPAISALARTMANMFPDQEYLAGLWKSDLHRGLLWTPYSPTDLSTYLGYPEGYIAPSWSWAHRCNTISWIKGASREDYDISPEFELREANIITETLNPYGRVLSGALELNAKLFQLPIYGGGGKVVEYKGPAVWHGVSFYHTLVSAKGEYIAFLHFSWRPSRKERPPPGQTEADRLWMVLISHSSPHDPSYRKGVSRFPVTSPEIMLGLLLLPTSNGTEFVKVGLWLSETRELGGRKVWDTIERQLIRLV